MNPNDPVPDDSLCATCGAKLPEDPKPGSWAYEGFCGLAHALMFNGAITLEGELAKTVASLPGGKWGGPGFEAEIIRAWLKGESAAAPATLRRIPSENDVYGAPPRAWAWRLYLSGDCRALRYTSRNGTKP